MTSSNAIDYHKEMVRLFLFLIKVLDNIYVVVRDLHNGHGHGHPHAWPWLDSSWPRRDRDQVARDYDVTVTKNPGHAVL